LLIHRVFASVIVTTYNRPDALRAVLDSLLAQRARDFEILVADDGSTAATDDLVKALAEGSVVLGFRAAAARNRAAARARGDLLIFLDGDCIARPDFIDRHRRLARPGWMVAGNRVLLSESFTREVLARRAPVHLWHPVHWRAAFRRGEINRLLPLAALPLGPLRRLGGRRWQRVRTCNLAVWRADFVAVNGFDESFEGWGFEDSDLAIRLIHHGVRRLEGAFATAVLHLWHRENDRAREGENWTRLQQRLVSRQVRAERGLSGYLPV
jgi:glycosyltransferase involved in cell wall biosynthesis